MGISIGRMIPDSGIIQRMQASEIESMIRTGFPDATIQIHGADGVHFEATVVSESFDGQRTLERHRAVYSALGAHMGTDIHALSLVTLTPSEYERKREIG
jgi:acid stress-induced BolA-like protein IbaG/YrbA